MATIEDLDRRSVLDPETGCIRWTGAHTSKGYGQIVLGGKSVSAHRASYERAFGPIPLGLEIDHVRKRGCRHRDCINPDHLEAVTHAVNIARKAGMEHTTHCPMGHEYTDENTSILVTRRGHVDRSCRRCRRERLSTRVPCPMCGGQVTMRNLSRHRRTHENAPLTAEGVSS